jgi:hypothetical protein
LRSTIQCLELLSQARPFVRTQVIDTLQKVLDQRTLQCA